VAAANDPKASQKNPFRVIEASSTGVPTPVSLVSLRAVKPNWQGSLHLEPWVLREEIFDCDAQSRFGQTKLTK